MAAMSDTYSRHDCNAMSTLELQGFQSLMMASRGRVRLDRAELAALNASPILRSWMLPHLSGFGVYQLQSLLDGREPIGLAEYLGQMREAIAKLIEGRTQ